MSAHARARVCAIGLSSLLALVGWGRTLLAADEYRPATPEERGRRIFLHDWQGNDPLGKGDGIGPMFNERSCVACHFLGGIGGAGPIDRNVDILTAILPSDGKKVKQFSFAKHLRDIHPAFAESTTLVLHRFSTNPVYPLYRLNFAGKPAALPELPVAALLSRSYAKQATPPPADRVRAKYGVDLMLTHRSTPALFGVGLIDKIPEAELRKLAEEETKNDWPISGRLVGRFGWRGQIGDLREFVLGACSNEVGLQVPNHAQAFDPLAGKKRSTALDLSDEQCGELIAYIASLPRPQPLPPIDSEQAEHVEQGRAMFEGVGCAICHRPTVGKVEGIYSDLLVHDLGQWLSDPVAAPDMATTSTPAGVVCHNSSLSGRSGYFGGSSGPLPEVQQPILAERRSEWRTPPLWGVRDSAPYLHDGRAATIPDAIRWHGGEAAGVVDRYFALDLEERHDLVWFLSTLAAPEMPAEQLATK